MAFRKQEIPKGESWKQFPILTTVQVNSELEDSYGRTLRYMGIWNNYCAFTDLLEHIKY